MVLLESLQERSYMPPVRFDIWWSETDHKTFKVDADQLVGDVVSEIKEQLGDLLPESDPANNIIEYMLFKVAAGHREPLLARKRTVAQARIVEGEQLYFANLRAPWWSAQPKASSYAKQQTVAATPPSCRLQLVANCAIDISREGLQLDRAFLLKSLPARVVALENTKSFAGLRSPLHAVSRKQHCAIIPQGAQWLLHAYDYTYIHNQVLTKGMTIQLTRSTTLVLGRDGWPIQIFLSS
jgi:hypothetical protein